ncbi:ADP-ribose pyrophosphatase YjhB (NUDIX family) [Kushneria sinocarnis]|uniref:ADP-ribose pyrophosphatase YjhB (NUDIX family) n=1 Tax=Kushneria sinocarnis TaxID=595502 RepID=A0A420WTQ5_9GAMM|nr:NUDIX domain-containing protein [Kushneria sinocarnis]RKQ96904.1 ADP-ribose pyrophosphatase YjhB (NUDIX family) [Kushneria sinocarnis]
MTDRIHVVAGCLLDADRRLLIVRKHATDVFMLPGGKPESGETPMATLLREWQEELGGELAEPHLVLLGRFSAPAAHEPDTVVDADVFEIDHAILDLMTPVAGGEIEAVDWLALDDTDASHQLAPLLRDAILPALRERHDIGSD